MPASALQTEALHHPPPPSPPLCIGLFDRRFTQDSHQKQVKQFTVTSSEVTKAFGTALAGLCFVDYLVPVFASDIHPPHHLRHDAHHAAGEL